MPPADRPDPHRPEIDAGIGRHPLGGGQVDVVGHGGLDMHRGARIGRDERGQVLWVGVIGVLVGHHDRVEVTQVRATRR